ncbi:MAG: hypothetical protein NWE86_00670 [Candidatus Bathyarchaeota archaeon]|nr:hypothetical protein [Candidatus Bathyarchaeota archaeon]
MKAEEKRKYSLILSAFSGITILSSSVLIINNPNILGISRIQTLPALILVTISLIFGCLMLFGSFLIYRKSKSGPIVVFIFSFLGLIIGGVLFIGFVIGFILGIIGAILGFSKGTRDN